MNWIYIIKLSLRRPRKRKWRATKEPLIEDEKREWKSWLKTHHSKNRSWHPVPSLMTNGEKMETVTDFISLGSKITADGDCSHEIKRRSLEENLWQTSTYIKKQRHHFADKGVIVKAVVFPAVMYRCELDHKEDWAPENWIVGCGSGEGSRESLGLQGDQTNQS